jgi:hypothetical protein
VGTTFRQLIAAINASDDQAVEQAVLRLSKSRRWLAPLALIVGAFLMLFQGLKLLVTNWRLTLVQVLPAMWIWVAMLDIKVHLLHDTRWGPWPFVISQSIVVGVMMFCYLAVPARVVGVEKKTRSRRDKLAATAVGGAVGAVVCSPPYFFARLGILMLGWGDVLFWIGIAFIVIGLTLQTGVTSAVKAVKFSAKLVG